MFNKKKLLRGILAAIIGGNLFLPSTTSAEIKTYTGTGEYIMSDFETPEVAKQRAKVYAERNAQEQAGVYVNSYSKMENFNLVADEIVTTIISLYQWKNTAALCTAPLFKPISTLLKLTNG